MRPDCYPTNHVSPSPDASAARCVMLGQDGGRVGFAKSSCKYEEFEGPRTLSPTPAPRCPSPFRALSEPFPSPFRALSEPSPSPLRALLIRPSLSLFAPSASNVVLLLYP